MRIALDYSANVNYLGIYVAQEKGWFCASAHHGQIIPYANTPAETLIESGNNDLCMSTVMVIINRLEGLGTVCWFDAHTGTYEGDWGVGGRDARLALAQGYEYSAHIRRRPSVS